MLILQKQRFTYFLLLGHGGLLAVVPVDEFAVAFGGEIDGNINFSTDLPVVGLFELVVLEVLGIGFGGLITATILLLLEPGMFDVVEPTELPLLLPLPPVVLVEALLPPLEDEGPSPFLSIIFIQDFFPLNSSISSHAASVLGLLK